MAEEKIESRLASLERNFKIALAMVLVSLSCSLVSLIIVLVVLFTT
jgi:hypothetical protein